MKVSVKNNEVSSVTTVCASCAGFLFLIFDVFLPTLMISAVASSPIQAQLSANQPIKPRSTSGYMLLGVWGQVCIGIKKPFFVGSL